MNRDDITAVALYCRVSSDSQRMIGSRVSGIAVRKSEIAASGTLVPAFEGPQQRPERQTDRAWCF